MVSILWALWCVDSPREKIRNVINFMGSLVWGVQEETSKWLQFYGLSGVFPQMEAPLQLSWWDLQYPLLLYRVLV